MDPVAQVLAQQSSGSAEGQGFGDFYAKGRQVSLQERYLALQQQEEARKQQEFKDLEPLRVQMAKDQAAISGATAVSEVQKQGAIAKSNMAIPDIIQLQIEASDLPGGTTNEQWRAKVREYTRTHPVEMSVGEGAKLIQMYQSGPIFEQKFKAVTDAEAKLRGTGMMLQEYDSATGKFKLSRNPDHEGVLSNIGKELQDYKALIASGDTENANLIKAKIIADADKNGVAIEFDDQGHPTRINIGGKSTTPPGMVARVEKTVNAAADLVEYGNDLIRLATEADNVGIWGNARRFAEQWGGQFGVQVNAQSAFDYASATALFRAGATQVLKSDSQIAEPERRELLNRVASAKLGESSASAIAETRYIQRKVAESARRQALRAGRPLAPQLMTPSEIVDAVTKGTMSREDGIKAVQSTPF